MFAAACETAIIDGVGTAEIPDPGGVYPDSYRPPSYDTNASLYSSVNIGADFLFNPNGGAVAYSGENLVMADDVGADFMTFFFTEHNNGYARLGDSWRKAQQDYFNQNYVSSPLIANNSNDAPFAAPRIYLGTANLFGDPSMRMQ